jgi:AraC-like DNA-binding protein
VDRTKGTSARDAPPPRDEAVIVTYRELAPSPELRGHVRAFFSFTPGAAVWRGQRAVTCEVRFTLKDSFCSPLFADGRASLVINLGARCELGRGWTFGTPVEARAIGALRAVGAPASNAHSEMIGVYLEPGATQALLQVPAAELTDRVANLEHLWGPQAMRLAEDLAELDEPARVDRLEAALLERVRHAPAPQLGVDVVGLAHWVRADPASMTVRRLANAASVSRQHLTRVFREVIGVSPKRYCRVARFQAGLAYVGAGRGVKWAQVAAELGYADQSHMIAEFRELSSLTPDALATQRWFHPFILEARSQAPNR